MRATAVPLRLTGSSTRRLLAGMAVSLAILLQVIVSAPLLLRMADQASASGLDGIPTCIAASYSAATHDEHHDGPAPAPHDHAHCLLCQGSLLPLLAADVSIPAPTPAILSMALAAYRGATPDGRRFEVYAPRGPPARA
jgi:hypothetical protein